MSNYWGHKIHSSIFILNIIGIFCLTLYSYNFFLDQNFLIFKFILVITLSASLLLEKVIAYRPNLQNFFTISNLAVLKGIP